MAFLGRERRRKESSYTGRYPKAILWKYIADLGDSQGQLDQPLALPIYNFLHAPLQMIKCSRPPRGTLRQLPPQSESCPETVHFTIICWPLNGDKASLGTRPFLPGTEALILPLTPTLSGPLLNGKLYMATQYQGCSRRQPYNRNIIIRQYLYIGEYSEVKRQGWKISEQPKIDPPQLF